MSWRKIFKFLVYIWIATGFIGFIFGFLRRLLSIQDGPSVQYIQIIQSILIYVAIVLLTVRFVRDLRFRPLLQTFILQVAFWLSSCLVNVLGVGQPIIGWIYEGIALLGCGFLGVAIPSLMKDGASGVQIGRAVAVGYCLAGTIVLFLSPCALGMFLPPTRPVWLAIVKREIPLSTWHLYCARATAIETRCGVSQDECHRLANTAIDFCTSQIRDKIPFFVDSETGASLGRELGTCAYDHLTDPLSGTTKGCVKCELRGGYAEIEKEQMENPIIAIAAQTFSPSEKTKINSLVKQLCEGDFVGAVTSMNEIEQQVSRPALSKASFEGLRSYALAVSAFYKELMPGVCSNGIDLHTTEGIARLGALGKDPTIAKLKELQEQAKVAMIRSGVGQTADSPSKEEISEAQVAFFNQASPSLNEKVNKFAEDDLCGIAQIAPEQIANALKLPAHQAKIVLRSLLSGN